MFLLLEHPRGSWNVSLIFVGWNIVIIFSLTLCPNNAFTDNIGWICRAKAHSVSVCIAYAVKLAPRIAQFSNEKLVSLDIVMSAPEHMRYSSTRAKPIENRDWNWPPPDPLWVRWEMVRMGVKSGWFMSYKWFNLRSHFDKNRSIELCENGGKTAVIHRCLSLLLPL